MSNVDRLQPAQDGALTQKALQLREAIIMMVDDEPLMLEVLKMHLFCEGYRNFITVEKSTEAMDIVRTEMPDVVFLDINMPEVDGFEILQQIRSAPDTQHLAVIILTSATDPQVKLKALRLGATDFLEKPIDASELTLRLRNTLIVKAYQDRLTYYDGLTGLPNRELFDNRVNTAVAHAQRTSSDVVLMNIAMDRFQMVNASMGPPAGDDILKQTAERLRKVVQELDARRSVDNCSLANCLARIGGDEFALLLPDLTGEKEVTDLAESLLAIMREPFTYSGGDVYSTVSIGIAQFPLDSSEPGLLVKNAGSARELAKELGRDNFQFYTQEMTARAEARRKLEVELRKAVAEEEFELYYQPKSDAHSGRIIGAECLLRWQHPERGLLHPGDFITLAEENGLVLDIGEWVLRKACFETRALQKQGLTDLRVSINLSARQFRQHDLPDIVEDACSSSGLDPQHLVLELTESLVMEDVEHALNLLHAIKKIGATISIDDFGTGYSALSYLKRFPVDELKIDQSFVRDVPVNEDDAAIITAIIVMSHTLDLRVVAEGVETEAQHDFLRASGCDELQGYLIARPMTQKGLQEFVSGNWSETPAA